MLFLVMRYLFGVCRMDSLIREMQGVSAQTNRLGMSPVSMAKGVVSKLGIH